MADHESVRTTTLELRREGASLLIWGFLSPNSGFAEELSCFLSDGGIRAGTRGICIQTGVSFHHPLCFNLGGRTDTRALLSSGPQLPFFFFELFFLLLFFLQMFGEEIWAFGIDTIVCFFALTPCFLRFFLFPGEPLPHWRSGSLFIWGWGGGLRNVFCFD